MILDSFKNRVFLAPMAGITDTAFRQIALEQGAGLTYTEMASAVGLKYGSKRTFELILPAPNEEKIGIQLFGNDPDVIKNSILTLCEYFFNKIALFDINMGCPAPKITGNGEGCALMKNLPLASKIISAAAGATKIPVTVKFRKGWDENSVNAVEFAKMAQDSGADAVAVHGRTRQQFYSGKSDASIIGEVKKAVKIPVIGNGDITCAKDAKVMFETTGCDAIMVARGALGNPFIFREINSLMATGNQAPSARPEEKATVLLKQAVLCTDYKGEKLAMLQMRKHAAWYFKGLPGAAKLRESAIRLTSVSQLKDLVLSVFPGLSL